MRLPFALLLFCLTAAAKPAPAGPAIRLATSADTHPYNFGADQGCKNKKKPCGFEIDLFDAICKEMNVRCSWRVNAWDKIFDDLVQPKPNGTFPYDAIVASAEASAERRARMLFSDRYYMAWHLFLGEKSLDVKVDDRGFPLDQGKKIRIGTWEGFLLDELKQAYPELPANIELIPVPSPLDSLKKKEVDLAFVFTGTEVGFLKDEKFEQKGRLIEVLNTDPEAGIGAATRKTAEGEKLRKLFSEGLARVRAKGIYQEISHRWLGRDIWDTQLGPKIETKKAPTTPAAGCAPGFSKLAPLIVDGI